MLCDHPLWFGPRFDWAHCLLEFACAFKSWASIVFNPPVAFRCVEKCHSFRLSTLLWMIQHGPPTNETLEIIFQTLLVCHETNLFSLRPLQLNPVLHVCYKIVWYWSLHSSLLTPALTRPLATLCRKRKYVLEVSACWCVGVDCWCVEVDCWCVDDSAVLICWWLLMCYVLMCWGWLLMCWCVEIVMCSCVHV